MAELDTTSITSADIDNYINANDDFAFELEVRNLCFTGERVEFGGTYIDPVTGKTRQFDIRAYWRRQTRVLQMAIECKRLQPYAPLVMSRVPRRSQESFHELIYCYERSFQTLRIKECRYESVKLVGKTNMQLRREMTARDKGKPTKFEFKSDDKAVFEKWEQALCSADELVRTAPDFVRTVGDVFVMVLPVVVIPDGTLWVVDYHERKGHMERQKPQPVDHASFYVAKDYGTLAGPTPRYCISHLEFFTFSAFRDFTRLLSNYQDQCEPFFRNTLFPLPQIENQISMADFVRRSAELAP